MKEQERGGKSLEKREKCRAAGVRYKGGSTREHTEAGS